MAIFDEFASHYDDWYGEKKGSFIDKVETNIAFEMLEIKKGMKILDVGCGTGNFCIKLAEAGCKVTGIDISEEMLAIARVKASEKKLQINFINMDVADLKFKDNEFDAVISMATVEFIHNVTKMIEEIFRVVKIEGQVFIGTINGDSDWGEFYRSKIARGNTVYKYAEFKTIQDMKSWNPNNLLGTGECLFVSPLADETEFNFEGENELKGKRKGGYICALWKK
ncbi:MAG: class I SAM-dependent methyltransferase [Clostridiaceae bacterium]